MDEIKYRSLLMAQSDFANAENRIRTLRAERDRLIASLRGGEGCQELVDDMAKAMYESFWEVSTDKLTEWGFAWDQLLETTKDNYRTAVSVVVQKLLERWER